MRIEIQAHPPLTGSTESRLRATLVNDAYEPVTISRNSFKGPNLRPVGGMAYPDSVEATFSGADEPLTLQPFTFYGRERSWALTEGTWEVSATYAPAGAPPLSESILIEVGRGVDGAG